MDFFDYGFHLDNHMTGEDCSCNTDLTDMLTAARISQGIDPLQAVLDAQLEAPLIQPFLF
jgi:hypothetical protein